MHVHVHLGISLYFLRYTYKRTLLGTACLYCYTQVFRVGKLASIKQFFEVESLKVEKLKVESVFFLYFFKLKKGIVVKLIYLLWLLLSIQLSVKLVKTCVLANREQTSFLVALIIQFPAQSFPVEKVELVNEQVHFLTRELFFFV